ncbi:MAG: DinB family protein [Candidatus Buchananbacteria bacterium]|nr:DinB family protein [Candidatus Buchananbacteria bacterium]
MEYKQFFLSELEREMPNTRKLLALVPEEQADWKPHAKSYSLEALASHLVQLTGFAVTMAKDETYDFSNWKNISLKTNAELLAEFDRQLEQTKAAIEALDETDFQKTWSMSAGETVIATFPKWDALQNIYLHHFIHHRAQLGVYLRLLNIPLPGMYGPSADEQ